MKNVISSDDKEYNLYWPIYQNIENELLNITNYVKFDDTQLKVYSDRFLDLIMRICIEIESISKELYLNNGGAIIEPESEMYFDTICLNFLEEQWELSKRIIQITNSNMYFSQTNSILQPLKKANKRGTSGSKWKQAYQSIKHNRSKNYSKGNLENCIMSLAALYILNIYYKNESFKLNNDYEVNNFDLSQGSKIFSIQVCKGHSLDGIMPENKSSIYFINYTDDFIKKAEDSNLELNNTYFDYVLKDYKFIEEMKKQNIPIEEIEEKAKTIGIGKITNIIGKDNHIKYMSIAVQKSKIHNLLENSKYVAYLNK